MHFYVDLFKNKKPHFFIQCGTFMQHIFHCGYNWWRWRDSNPRTA